jgi:hypothetical protein
VGGGEGEVSQVSHLSSKRSGIPLFKGTLEKIFTSSDSLAFDHSITGKIFLCIMWIKILMTIIENYIKL